MNIRLAHFFQVFHAIFNFQFSECIRYNMDFISKVVSLINYIGDCVIFGYLNFLFKWVQSNFENEHKLPLVIE